MTFTRVVDAVLKAVEDYPGISGTTAWAAYLANAAISTDRAERAASPEVHAPQCPALAGDECTCARHEPTVDKAWAQFCGGIGDGPNAPYPGMIGAFEHHYGQSFADKEWREEASVWAAAWKARDSHPASPPLQAAPTKIEAVDYGPTFGIIDPDYAVAYTKARIAAWQHGYAIALHGSFTRDLDLVAVPWTEQASDAETLIAALEYRTGLKRQGPPTDKPHGRKAVSLLFPDFEDPRWVDVSVLPRQPAP